MPQHRTLELMTRRAYMSLLAARVAAPPTTKTLRRTCVKTRAMAGVVRYEVGKRMSEASKYNGIIHLAGQVADDASQDITGQTKQVLAQVDRLLAQAGSHKSNILMTQIFLSDVASQFAAMNAVYDTWIVPGHTAPRATVRDARTFSASCMVLTRCDRWRATRCRPRWPTQRG